MLRFLRLTLPAIVMIVLQAGVSRAAFQQCIVVPPTYTSTYGCSTLSNGACESGICSRTSWSNGMACVADPWPCDKCDNSPTQGSFPVNTESAACYKLFGFCTCGVYSVNQTIGYVSGNVCSNGSDCRPVPQPTPVTGGQ